MWCACRNECFPSNHLLQLNFYLANVAFLNALLRHGKVLVKRRTLFLSPPEVIYILKFCRQKQPHGSSRILTNTVVFECPYLSSDCQLILAVLLFSSGHSHFAATFVAAHPRTVLAFPVKSIVGNSKSLHK